MGAGGEAQDKNAGERIAEAGNGTRPVFVILVGAAASVPDPGTVVAQAGTAFAGNDGVADTWLLGEGRRQWAKGFRQSG